MAILAKWLRKAVDTFVDPEREDRLREAKRLMQAEFFASQQKFVLANFLVRHPLSPQDSDFVRNQIYTELISRGWEDGILNSAEQEVAKWAATALQLSPETASKINQKFGFAVFQQVLADAFEDGQISPEEQMRLEQLAASMGMSLSKLMQSYFRLEGEAFLRGLFLSFVSDGRLTSQEWNHLLNTTAKLGLTSHQLIQAVQPQAKACISHVLADATMDGVITDHEEQMLRWLIQTFPQSQDFSNYVNTELYELKTITEAAHGRLSAVAVPANIEMRAGEIAHYYGYGRFVHTKHLSSGPKSVVHEGMITITDHRLIFTSATVAFSLNFRKVLSHIENSHGVQVHCESARMAGLYNFYEKHRLAYAIFKTAIGRANQTIVQKVEGQPSRHIPRDVRQRVWQKYGGQCAECAATEYLEFDHVIPVAKGGNNADNNVQLLCRKCNLTKSDAI